MRNSPKQVFAGGWDKITSAVYTENILDGLVDIGGFFIKPDGTMLFLELTNTIQAYDLSVPWDVFSAGPIIASFPITDDSNALGLSFSPDGTIMIVVGENTKILYSYVLPNPWDITSIIAAPTTMSLAVMLSSVYNCAFSRDGDYVFVNDIVDIHSFPLPTAYDITSNVTSTSSTLGLAVFGGFAFKPEGNRMYVVDLFNETIHEFELSTINDITTATPTGNTLSIFQIIGGNTLIFRPNGNEFFATSIGSGEIKKLSMTNSWDIPNASYFTNEQLIPSPNPIAISWKPDGTKYYIADFNDDTITEFTTIHPFNQSGATQTAQINVTTIQNRIVGMSWNPDGTMLFIIGTAQDRINRLNFSVPYDLSTFTDPAIFFLVPGLRFPTGVFFRYDGLKFYVSNNDVSDTIVEFDMSIAWDITTATFVGDLDVDAITSSTQDLFLKNDGQRLYVIDVSGIIARFNLLAPWDVSSGVHIDSIDVSAQETACLGLFIRQDNGKKLYFLGRDMDTLVSYDMGV